MALPFRYFRTALLRNRTACEGSAGPAEKNGMAAIKILLVDDDGKQNTIMRNLLEREGFEITVASNVAEALKLISSERYDVLLSDLHMPGAADGLTVISAMRHFIPKEIP